MSKVSGQNEEEKDEKDAAKLERKKIRESKKTVL